MRTISVPDYIKHFITTISHRGMADMHVRLSQNLHGYLGYYFCLQTAFGSDLSPRTVAPAYFFLFARATLDCLAEIFCDFFTLPLLCATINHTSLTAVFLDTCAKKKLTGDVADIYVQMCDLDACIPRTNSDICSESSSVESGAIPEDATLLSMLTRIDQYTVALLRFCEQNLEQSALRYAPLPEKP